MEFMVKYQNTEWTDIFRKIKLKGGHTDEDKKETSISAGTDRRTAEEAYKEYHHNSGGISSCGHSVLFRNAEE